MQLTQSIVPEHLDVSQQQVSKLLERLGLDLGAGLDEIRRRYIGQLRSRAAGHGSDALATERLKLTAARRRKAEVELRERSGELVEADQIRRALVGISAGLRSTLERLPDVLVPRLATLTDEGAIAALLTREIDQALLDFAGALRAGKFSRDFAVDRERREEGGE